MPLNTIHQEAIASFQQQHPEAKVTEVLAGGTGDLATKIRTTTAAGAAPEGFFHYSNFWRGTNAATIMLPLTPQLYRRTELEQLHYGNLLNSVWAKNNEVYFLPAFVGLNATMALCNASLLGSAGLDPQGFTTLEAILAGATRLVVREGGAITRAGLVYAYQTNLIQNWILDQGGQFYDEKSTRWSWQTPEAERAFQWILDTYDKHAVVWREAPPGTGNALGEGRAGMIFGQGAFSLSGYAVSHPDVKLVDVPLPSFVPGRQPHYYLPGIAGYSLSALLKPDDPKTRLGVAFYRHLLAPERAMALADQYSGAILLKSVYSDPRFKGTRFGAVRAKLPEQIISKTLMLTMAADLDFGAQYNQVIAGELSIKAALGDMQQQFTAREEEARRALG
jgi:maltose-binding protein MalE